jgi:hypothetical protein
LPRQPKSAPLPKRPSKPTRKPKSALSALHTNAGGASFAASVAARRTGARPVVHFGSVVSKWAEKPISPKLCITCTEVRWNTERKVYTATTCAKSSGAYNAGLFEHVTTFPDTPLSSKLPPRPSIRLIEPLPYQETTILPIA